MDFSTPAKTAVATALAETATALEKAAEETRALRADNERLMHDLHRAMMWNEGLQEALDQIIQWAEAYPLPAFPEPDFAKAAELLQAGGMTLDSLSASAMRHVVRTVAAIAKRALEDCTHRRHDDVLLREQKNES
jgi:hypothetical protein